MRLTYVDEAYSQERDWLFLVSFTIPPEHDKKLRGEVYEVLDPVQQFLMDNLKDLRRGSTFEVEERNEISKDLYSHLDDEIEYHVHAVAFHKDAMDKDDDTEIYLQAFKYLLERIEHFLNRQDEWGVVYIDTSSKAPDVQQAHSRLEKRGSDYLDFDHVASLCAPVDDELSWSMQMADLVGAAVRAYLLDIDTRWLVNYVGDHIDRHPMTNDPLGTGIKIFPGDSAGELPIFNKSD